MKRKSAHYIAVIGSLILALLGFYFGRDIPFKDQWPLYESLRSTSAIIFAVIGAWLTILYPESLQKIFSKQLESSSEQSESIELLVLNIRYS